MKTNLNYQHIWRVLLGLATIAFQVATFSARAAEASSSSDNLGTSYAPDLTRAVRPAGTMDKTDTTQAEQNRGQLSLSDYKFARNADSGGMMEVNLGKLASEKSTNPSVQQFGQRMVQDHGKAGQELADIAKRKGATLPTETMPEQQREMDRLSKLSGKEFDKAYIKMMVQDHKEDAREFKRASESCDDTDLKAFAISTLAVVQDHLKMAQDLDDNLKQISMNEN